MDNVVLTLKNHTFIYANLLATGVDQLQENHPKKYQNLLRGSDAVNSEKIEATEFATMFTDTTCSGCSKNYW